MKITTSRIMLVGTGSGCGKTTVTIGLLKALKNRNMNIAGFKSGPDYIDPMFHNKALGIKSGNLDLFLLDERTVHNLFYKNAHGRDIAVIEGAMGMYDGKGFEDDRCSANHLASVLKIPQILVADVKGKSLSLLAEISGFLNFKKNNLKGVILNNCNPGMYQSYKKMIENNLPLKVFGYLPKIDDAVIKSRHLGLVTADEISDIEKKLTVLARQAESSIDIDKIISAARDAEEFDFEPLTVKKVCENEPVIAVARDNAFCFYYQDGLDLLEESGAKLVYFSPLTDKKLPENISGIVLGGGYPEVYARQLSENTQMLSQIKKAAESSVPVYAECGGFIYLGKSYKEGDRIYSFCNVTDSEFYMTERLVRFGYSTLFAKHENMLMPKDSSVRCHEFHYTDADFTGDDLISRKSAARTFSCGICRNNIFALYPHIHFYSNISLAEAFVKACSRFKSGDNANRKEDNI